MTIRLLPTPGLPTLPSEGLMPGVIPPQIEPGDTNPLCEADEIALQPPKDLDTFKLDLTPPPVTTQVKPVLPQAAQSRAPLPTMALYSDPFLLNTLYVLGAAGVLALGAYVIKTIRDKKPAESAPTPAIVPEAELLIGRGLHVGLKIQDATLDYGHAHILKTPDGDYYLEDLGSQNGTYLVTPDDRYDQLEPRKPRKLKDGDIIALSRNTKIKVSLKGTQNTSNAAIALIHAADQAVRRFSGSAQSVKESSNLILTAVEDRILDPKASSRWVDQLPYTFKFTSLAPRKNTEVVKNNHAEVKRLTTDEVRAKVMPTFAKLLNNRELVPETIYRRIETWYLTALKPELETLIDQVTRSKTQVIPPDKIDNLLQRLHAELNRYPLPPEYDAAQNFIWGEHNHDGFNFSATDGSGYGTIFTSSSMARKYENEKPDKLTNEDSVIPMPNGNGVIIFDGMGGHSGGANASRILTSDFWIHSATNGSQLALSDSFDRVVQGLIDYREANPTKVGKDSGAVGLAYRIVTVDGKPWLQHGHIGDTGLRVYRRDHQGQYVQIRRTFEHNLAMAVVRSSLNDDDPQLTEIYHKTPQANIVTRTITTTGYKGGVPEYDEMELQSGDLIIAYGDGIGDNLVELDFMEAITKGQGDPEKINQILFDMTRDDRRRNGTDSKDDDITVSVFRVN